MFPVLAAMFLWSVFEILRLRLDVQLRPRLNSRPFFPGQSTELPVITAITRYLLDWKYVLAFFLIFMLWLPFLDPRHPFQLFDNCSFGFQFEVSLCILMAMMLSCAFRLNLVWAKLKMLLEELDRSRLRVAFSRLKGFGWSPIWKQGGQQTDWIDINTSLEA